MVGCPPAAPPGWTTGNRGRPAPHTRQADVMKQVPVRLLKKRLAEPERLEFASPGRSPGKGLGKQDSPVRARDAL